MPPASVLDSLSTLRVAVVLGGGGLRGFAHIGVLRALAEYGIEPVGYVGTSIGSIIATAAAGGVDSAVMADHARSLRRPDLLRLAKRELLLHGVRARSVYQGGPLEAVVARIVPDVLLSELPVPCFVNTVDLSAGHPLVWGGRLSYPDARAREAVVGSCSLPGLFPAHTVDGIVCVDGGVLDNLGIEPAKSMLPDLIIAVDVSRAAMDRAEGLESAGLWVVYQRAADVMQWALRQSPLDRWQGPPVLLIEPPVGHLPRFAFGTADRVMAAGYEAAMRALTHLPHLLSGRRGITTVS